MKRYLITMIAVLIVPASTLLALDGNEVLSRVEDATSPAATMHAVERMTVVGAGGARELRTVEVFQKEPGSYLVRFLEPADIRGVAVLVIPDGNSDRIYLYLPASRRERRIAGHVRNDNFLGTDLSYQDIAERHYSDDYRVVSLREAPDSYTLSLEQKSADVAYTRVVMKVDRKTYLPLETELYKEGQVVKRLVTEKIASFDSHPTTAVMTVESVEKGSYTRLEAEEVHYNEELADDTFSVRTLRRFR